MFSRRFVLVAASAAPPALTLSMSHTVRAADPLKVGISDPGVEVGQRLDGVRL